MRRLLISIFLLGICLTLVGCEVGQDTPLPDEILIVYVNGPKEWKREHKVTLRYQDKSYPLPAIILRDEDARTFTPGMPRFLIVDDHALMFEEDGEVGLLYVISHGGSGFEPEKFGDFVLKNVWHIGVSPTPDAEYIPYLDRELFDAAQTTGSMIDLRTKEGT